MSIPVAQETAPLLLIQRRIPWGLLGLLALAFIVVPLSLLVIAALAALIPARKARQIDPLAALRID